jgi:hypothetical protein
LKYACLLAVLAASTAVLVPQATARQHASTHVARPDSAKMARLLSGIVARRDETWRWQRLMHRGRTPYRASVEHILTLPYRQWVYRLWRERATTAKAQALNPPHRAQWQCIHHYEGSWTDPNAPYYGGLQMDLEFQSTYGRELLRSKGTADHWTPLEQMWVAERAYRTRGFWPWPNTARYCGLL